MTELLTDVLDPQAPPPVGDLRFGYAESSEQDAVRELSLAVYDSTPGAAPPVEVRSFPSYAWGELANVAGDPQVTIPGAKNGVGNCGPAMLMHGDEQAQLTVGGHPVPYTSDEAVVLYEETGGFDPSKTKPNGSNPTDNGTTWTQLSGHWQTVGVGGNKILGSAKLPMTLPPAELLSLVDRGIFEFDCVFTAIGLPAYMQNQKIWAIDPSKSQRTAWWHWIPIFSFDRTHYAFVSWGRVTMMTKQFFLERVRGQKWGEAHVVVSPRQASVATGKTASGLLIPRLVHDLTAMGV